MIDIGKECCGCTACSNICPQKCIEMRLNEEGFMYPVCNVAKCMECGLCEKACPVVHSTKYAASNPIKRGYVFQNRNLDILKESTSGGFFSALAEWVIRNGGLVYGAAYNEDFYIHHIAVDTVTELYKFRNSKYTQSDAEDVFSDCRENLLKGRMVLFSGTPCQIAGLKTYLGKEYENLITCDIVCRGVPSPGLFRHYVNWIGGSEKISNIVFREKYKGYYSSFMTIHLKNGRYVRREKYGDPMLSFFFNDLCSRPSCYNCHFKTLDRASDFTIFDSWHGFRHDNKFGNKGTTAVIARNEYADRIIKLLSEKNLCIEADCIELVKEDGCMMTASINMNLKRKAFFADMEKLSFDKLVQKYNKKSIKKKIVIFIKMTLAKIGIFGKIIQYKIR